MRRYVMEGRFARTEEDAFIADTATVVGDVELHAGASVWFYAVLRGDDATITIGKNTSIQDGTVVHPMIGEPLEVGDHCTVGHRAVLHCSKIGRCTVIGMGSILLGGSEIGEGSIVAGGSLVRVGMKFPPCSLIAGAPARVVKELPQTIFDENIKKATDYVEKAKKYLPVK